LCYRDHHGILISSQRCVTPPRTQYRITVLNVISLSYIMPSVIIRHDDSLCTVLCVDISLFCLVQCMDSRPIAYSLCISLHFLYYYIGCII